jgi:hypothetical protein
LHSDRAGSHAIPINCVKSREMVQGLHTTAHNRNMNEEADMLAKVATIGDPLPSDVFFHVIGTPVVRTQRPQNHRRPQ